MQNSGYKVFWALFPGRLSGEFELPPCSPDLTSPDDFFCRLLEEKGLNEQTKDPRRTYDQHSSQISGHIGRNLIKYGGKSQKTGLKN